MKQQNLSESAAIVEIVKQFFEQPAEPELKVIIEEIVTEKLADTQDEVATLKTQMAQMQQHLAIAMSGKTPQKSRTQSFTKPKLQPLKAEDLARRLGVNTETVEQEAAKGEEHFRAWSQSKDIGRVTWEKRGNLYHPLNSRL
ncbi:MAG: hypothetical protein WBB43_17075 [Limnoraphis sp.]